MTKFQVSALFLLHKKEYCKGFREGRENWEVARVPVTFHPHAGLVAGLACSCFQVLRMVPVCRSLRGEHLLGPGRVKVILCP